MPRMNYLGSSRPMRSWMERPIAIYQRMGEHQATRAFTVRICPSTGESSYLDAAQEFLYADEPDHSHDTQDCTTTPNFLIGTSTQGWSNCSISSGNANIIMVRR